MNKAQQREVNRQLEEHRAKRAAPAEFKNTLNVDVARLHPVADQVLLAIEVETETEGGILLPASAVVPSGLPVGRVLAIGDEVKRYKVGELVLCPQRDVSKVDTLLWLVPESKVLCRVDPKPEPRLVSPH